jgi:hypothetical protein
MSQTRGCFALLAMKKPSKMVFKMANSATGAKVATKTFNTVTATKPITSRPMILSNNFCARE